MGYYDNIFLFIRKKVCCWYSLESASQAASNEYRQHMLLFCFFACFFFFFFFLWRNEENISIYLVEKLAYLLLKPRCIHFIQLCNVMGNLFFNRNNFVKLNIFYESLNFETIEEEPLIDVRHLSRDTAFSTRLHVLQAMTQISLRECEADLSYCLALFG